MMNQQLPGRRSLQSARASIGSTVSYRPSARASIGSPNSYTPSARKSIGSPDSYRPSESPSIGSPNSYRPSVRKSLGSPDNYRPSARASTAPASYRPLARASIGSPNSYRSSARSSLGSPKRSYPERWLLRSNSPLRPRERNHVDILILDSDSSNRSYTERHSLRSSTSLFGSPERRHTQSARFGSPERSGRGRASLYSLRAGSPDRSSVSSRSSTRSRLRSPSYGLSPSASPSYRPGSRGKVPSSEFHIPDQWVELLNVEYFPTRKGSVQSSPVQLAPLWYNVPYNDVKFLKPSNEKMKYCMRYDVKADAKKLLFLHQFNKDLEDTIHLQAKAIKSGYKALKKRKFVKARNHFRTAVDSGGHLRPEVWQGYAESSLHAWEISPSLNPDLLPPLLGLFENALKYRANQMNFSLHLGMAKVYMHGGGLVEALKRLNGIVELGPYCPVVEQAMLLAAETYGRLQRPTEELKCLDFLVGAPPPQIPEYVIPFQGAIRHRDVGNVARSGVLFESAYELSCSVRNGILTAAHWLSLPDTWADFGKFLMQIGAFYYAQGAYVEAVKRFQKGHPRVLYDLARCQRMTLHPEAEATLTEAYKCDMYDPTIRTMLSAWHPGWNKFFNVQEFCAIKMQAMARQIKAKNVKRFLQQEKAREDARDAETSRKLMEFWYFRNQGSLKKVWSAWKYYTETQRREKGQAATLMQMLARRRLAEKALADRRRQATELQGTYLAVVKLFNRGLNYRIMEAWKYFTALSKQHRHATRINCLGRMIISYRRVRIMRYVKKRENERRYHYLITVFNVWYFKIRKQKYGDMAAADIQRMYRGMRDRRRVRKMKRAIVQLKRVFLGDHGIMFFHFFKWRHYLLRETGARKIQAVVRGFLARKHGEKRRRIKELFFRACETAGRKCFRAWYRYLCKMKQRRDNAARSIQTLRHVFQARQIFKGVLELKRSKERNFRSLQERAYARRLYWILWYWWEDVLMEKSARQVQRLYRGWKGRRFVHNRRGRIRVATRAVKMIYSEYDNFVVKKIWSEWQCFLFYTYHATLLCGFGRIVLSKQVKHLRINEISTQQKAMLKVLVRQAWRLLSSHLMRWIHVVKCINSANTIKLHMKHYMILRQQTRLCTSRVVNFCISAGIAKRIEDHQTRCITAVQSAVRTYIAGICVQRMRHRLYYLGCVVARCQAKRIYGIKERNFHFWVQVKRREAAAGLVIQLFFRVQRALRVANRLRRQYQKVIEKIEFQQQRMRERLLQRCIHAFERVLIQSYDEQIKLTACLQDSPVSANLEGMAKKLRRPLLTDFQPPSPYGDDALRPLSRTARREHTGEALSMTYFKALRNTQQTGTFTWDRTELSLRECREVAAAANTVICRKVEDEDLDALARSAATQTLRRSGISKAGSSARGKRSLEKIVLCNGALSPSSWPGLGRLVHGCGSLKSLSLVGCSLGNKGALALSEAWLKAGSTGALLSELCLDGCQIGTPGATALAHAVKDSKCLEKLVLSHNRLSCEFNLSVRDMLIANRSLRHLDLSYCELSDPVLIGIGTALDIQNFSQSALEHLRVNGNKGITDKSAVLFAEALEHNVVLTNLDMSDCSVTDEGCCAFAQCILFNKQIKSIWLCNNLIVQSGVEAMERAIMSRNAMKMAFSPSNSSLNTPDLFSFSGFPSRNSSINSTFDAQTNTGFALPQEGRIASYLDFEPKGKLQEKGDLFEKYKTKEPKNPIEVLLDGNPIATAVIQRYAELTGKQIFENSGLLAVPNLLPQTIVDNPRSQMSRPFTAPAFNFDFMKDRTRGDEKVIKYSQSVKLPALEGI